MADTVDKAETIEVVPASRPGKWYEIRKGADGVIYCTCRGWVASKKSPKTCKHLRGFLARNPEIENSLIVEGDRYVLPRR